MSKEKSRLHGPLSPLNYTPGCNCPATVGIFFVDRNRRPFRFSRTIDHEFQTLFTVYYIPFGM